MSVDYGMNRSLLLKTYKNTRNRFPSDRDHDEGRENAYIFFCLSGNKNPESISEAKFYIC
jgi:hypothetical protein